MPDIDAGGPVVKTAGSLRSEHCTLPELDDFRRHVTMASHSKRMDLILAVREAVHAKSAHINADSVARGHSISGPAAMRHRSTLDDIREEDSAGVGLEEPPSALMPSALMPNSAGSSGMTSGAHSHSQLRPIRTRAASIDGTHLPLPRSSGAALFSEKSGPITVDMLEQRQKLLAASICLDHHGSTDLPACPHTSNPIASLNSPVTGTATDFFGNRSPVSSRTSGNLLASAPLQRLPTPPSCALSASASGRRTSWRSAGNSRTNPPLSPSQRPDSSPLAAENSVQQWPPTGGVHAPPPGASTCLSRSFSWPYDRSLAALDFQGRSRMHDDMTDPEQGSMFFASVPYATLALQRQAVNTRYALLHKRLMTTCVPLPKCADFLSFSPMSLSSLGFEVTTHHPHPYCMLC